MEFTTGRASRLASLCCSNSTNGGEFIQKFIARPPPQVLCIAVAGTASVTLLGSLWCQSVGLASIAFVLLLFDYFALLLNRPSAAPASPARGAEAERLVLLETSLPGLIYQWRVDDGRTEYTAFAGSLLTVLGFTSEEALRDPHALLAFLDPADRARRDMLIALCSETEAGYSDQFRLTTRSGQMFWVRCTCTYYRDDKGVSLWTSLWTDVTEQHQARELAEAGSQAKTELLANVSHELRTPLNAIIGFNELLADGQLSSDGRRYVNRTAEAAGMLLSLVNQILGLSRISQDDAAVSALAFDLRDLLDSSASLIASAAAKKNISINISVGPDVPAQLSGDYEKIKQVLLNFLSNAVKFTQQGSVDIWVTRLDHHGSSAKLRFAVVDTGVGIDQDGISKLFNRYTQVGGGFTFGGSGLGLAISRDLVRRMGGETGASSSVGIGSTFWFELALDIVDRPILVPERPINERRAVDTPLRILVAEDFEPNRELITTVLEAAGHEVHAVCDGTEAIAAAAANDYAMIFMDVQMPRTDGVAAATAIRAASGCHGSVPIVALTAGTRRNEVDRCLAAGMTAYVTKPFAKADLLNAVSSWARHKPQDAVSGVNREVLDGIERRHGVAKLVGYLETFFDDVRNANTRLHAAPPRDEIGRIAHGLVGSSGQLGFRGVYDAARNLMMRMGDNDGADEQPYIDELQRQASIILSQASALLRHFVSPSVPCLASSMSSPQSSREDRCNARCVAREAPGARRRGRNDHFGGGSGKAPRCGVSSQYRDGRGTGAQARGKSVWRRRPVHRCSFTWRDGWFGCRS